MVISKMILNDLAVFETVFAGEYALHQAVWDMFADSPDRRRDFIYRFDSAGRMPMVYAVSSRAPHDPKGLWIIESKEYAPKIEAGMKLGFTARVNPTVKRDGKRHDVIMDAKHQARVANGQKDISADKIAVDPCANWLDKRAQENGFNVSLLRSDGYKQIKFNKVKGGVSVSYSTVDLTGILEVADPEAFVKMLFTGLGPEKGFGCGLMLVRKI